MKIQILGTGCPRCQKLAANVEEAVKLAGVEAEIEKITEIAEIVQFGVMMPPALAVDGTVKSSGKIPSPVEIAAFLK
jgi:small redox-active disulfide protein 2